ncbi:MAG: hypothetical protein Ct9H90mP2_09370 [Dehalococcoidia bacterium]|nr:MAG: hypothetical protein Ct9H90mP2_09370 [Dehalococcoidia bacterium]
MTQTVAPAEFYEGQGVWFQGCKNPEEGLRKILFSLHRKPLCIRSWILGKLGQKVTNFYNIDPKQKGFTYFI